MLAPRNQLRLFWVIAGLHVVAYSLAAQCGAGPQAPLCAGCPPPCYSVSVTPKAGPFDAVAGQSQTVSFTVKNTGNTTDAWDLTCSTTGNETCQNVQPASYLLGAGQQASIYVTFTAGPLGTSGTLQLLADNNPRSSDSGSYVISNVGAPPVVSLLPYNAGVSLAGDGVSYAHSVAAFGSMGGARSLTLTYNSAAARPTSLVAVDVSNSVSPYPLTYQLQVQLTSTGVFLQLLNGTTSVYYTAGTTTTTRMIAAVDAKANGLATGWYPVNIAVTANYSSGSPRTVSVSSRLLVNDQTSSPFGAGVGLAGLPQLYSMPGSYGLLLVNGDGRMAYFDRTCSTCAFVSPAAESGSLAVYNDPLLGQLYRLTELDRSIEDFGLDGRLLRHSVLASIQDLTFTWTTNLLTSVTDASGRGFSLSYVSGVLTQIADPANRVTGVTVAGGQLVKVTDPDGLSDSLSYGANSLLTQVIDRAGGTWSFAYNALNQQASATGPAALDYTGASVRPTTTQLTPDLVIWQPATPGTSASPKGNVRPDTVIGSRTDPVGNTTKVALDRFGLPTKVVDALGEVTTITRDTLGNPTEVVSPNGHDVATTYNGYLPASTLDRTTGQSLLYSWSNNQLQSTWDGAISVNYTYHDGTQGPSGTLKQVTVAGVVQEQHFPNAYGQDTLLLDALGHRTRNVYAAASAGGNLSQAIDPKNHVTSYHYNAYGLADTTTFMTGARIATAYDVMTRPTTSVNPLGNTTQYFYGPLGLTRIQDAKGQVYKFDLNAWGLTVARHDLGDTTKVDSLKYDVGGNLRTVKTRRGDTITFTYDALGRVLTRSGPDFPQEAFSHGLNGQWEVASNANGRDSVAYDQAGRVASVSQRMPDGVTTYQMTYTYDSRSRLISRSAPAGGSIARWVYNSGLVPPDTLCGVGTCAAFGRDVERKADTIAYNAGQAGAWSLRQTFDSLHKVTRDSFTVTQLSTDFNSTWTYDSLMRLSSSRQSGAFGPTNYAYDPAGQLINACYVGGFPQTCTNEYGTTANGYRYDPAGNRTDSSALAFMGPGNRIQQFKNYWLSYDLNGDVTRKDGLGASGRWSSSDTTTLQWNAQGQLTRVEKWPAGGAHGVTTFAYDALGRRVAKTVNGVTTWFLYDGDQVIMDINTPSATLAAEYAYTDANNLFAMRTPSWTGIALKDPAIHGVMGMAAAQGGSEIKNYGLSFSTPWGQVASDTGTPVRFRLGGQEYDQETGLYSLRARYYDPQLGRFLSEDPIGIAGGLNLYAYAGNDPVNARDPSGLELTLDGGGGGGDICFSFTTYVWHRVTIYNNEGGVTSSQEYYKPGTTTVMCSGGTGGIEGDGSVGDWRGGGGGASGGVGFRGLAGATVSEVSIYLASGFKNCPIYHVNQDSAGDKGTVTLTIRENGEVVSREQHDAWVTFNVRIANPMKWWTKDKVKKYTGWATVYLEPVPAYWRPGRPLFTGKVSGGADCDIGAATFTNGF